MLWIYVVTPVKDPVQIRNQLYTKMLHVLVTFGGRSRPRPYMRGYTTHDTHRQWDPGLTGAPSKIRGHRRELVIAQRASVNVYDELR